MSSSYSRLHRRFPSIPPDDLTTTSSSILSGPASTHSSTSCSNLRRFLGTQHSAGSLSFEGKYSADILREVTRVRLPAYTLTTNFHRSFIIGQDPREWGSNLAAHIPEPDDYLHDPDTQRDGKFYHGGDGLFSPRSFLNLGCLLLVSLALLALFVGYPIITHVLHRKGSTHGGFNLGGMNASGQIPVFIGNWGLIDNDTPPELHTKPSYTDPSKTLQLVFSDEFNEEGRSFYPGDDPYWEAEDMHYWATNNLEWYDPAAITTRNGALEIRLSNDTRHHDMAYTGGMMTTWNKFCFTGGLLEASVTLPGFNDVAGLWPAIWTMGNLGRAGYGATLDGMWPYSYDACDVGTVKNQTINSLPSAAANTSWGGPLSYLPGQKLSRCTCKGESHPGPKHKNGEYVGRSAPEIDVFEAQSQAHGDLPIMGQVSQSAQWGPFNADYSWFNTSDNMVIPNTTGTYLNSYLGAVYQQATSGVSYTNQQCYEMGATATQCFSVYAFEYAPGFDDAYITWVTDSKLAWTVKQSGLAADTRTEISARPIPQEPLYIIMNLGLSEGFGDVDVAHLIFPVTMRVDWVRVYQEKNKINIGCNPKNFPTTAYINEYIEAYRNPNLTTWVNDFKQPFPKNKLLGEC